MYRVLTVFAKETRSWCLMLLLLVMPYAVANELEVREIVFDLHAPQAKTVEIIGDFNQWQSGLTLLVGPDHNGDWKLKMKLPISVNRIEFYYLVDGSSRQVDSINPVISDEYSGHNNVISIP